ncbi:FtsB family cell division protein [Eggerthella timonensis]|uniref:FtsB family cell division protein n=1 Tax=Eggerthella timonensis TaxID=1871008 RepID=UPI0015E14244|nr:septum formation initiator family protein [Eggerthella timonensis]
MATQPYILSFDEAKRDTRARRPASAAPESRPVIHTVDAIPSFESPFRQPGESRGSARTPAHARSASASRRPSASVVDGSFARISTFDRPAGRHAAPRPSSSARRSSGPYGAGRFTSFDERIEEQPEEDVEERRLTRKEQRKKARAKSKAERAFTKQFGGSKPSDASQAGPRAAVYKGEMGAKHRQAARMQNAESAQASAKRGFSLGSLASLKSSPKFIASAAVVVCLVLSCAFLYSPAQQYYHALRERDQLAAEYAALEERNGALESDVSSLQTDAGIEDRAHEQFGWVKKGEETANVRGLDLDEEEASSFRANITPGSVEAPETWYSPFLDALFGVE